LPPDCCRQPDHPNKPLLCRNPVAKSRNVHRRLIDILYDKRIFCSGLSDQNTERPPILQGFSSSRDDAAQGVGTTTCGRQYSRQSKRKMCRCSTVITRHTAATSSGSGSRKRMSLKISLCRRTTNAEMLPASVKPTRVFVLWVGGRPGGSD